MDSFILSKHALVEHKKNMDSFMLSKVVLKI